MDKHGNQLKDHWLAGLSKQGAAVMTRENLVELFFEGDEAFEAMIEAIRGAEVFVHLEMYMFLSDEVGWSIAAAFVEKALAGVPVRVVYDGIGSGAADGAMFQEMADAGVMVEVFRPVAPWRKRSGIMGRNHRKNLIIDGRVAFTGGMNLGKVWSRRASGDEVWRDTHVRLEGPAAAACDLLFRRTWKKVARGMIPEKGHFQADGKGPGKSDCIVVGGSGFGKGRAIRRLYSNGFRSAQEDIVMTVPYFVPPKRLMDVMRKRSREGVAIEVLVPRNSDVAVADWLREGLYPALMGDGISFHEYTASVLHAKSVVIDERLAMVGSSNFDYLSVSWNWELAVVIDDAEVVKKLRKQYAVDLARSEKVTPESVGVRPLWRRMLAWIGAAIIRRL